MDIQVASKTEAIKINVVCRHYYKPYLSTLKYKYAHEYDGTSQFWLDVLIDFKKIENKQVWEKIHFILPFNDQWGEKVCFPCEIYKTEKNKLYIEILSKTSSVNNQNWWLCDIKKEFAIQKGVIFVNEVDVYEDTQKELKKIVAKQATKKEEGKKFYSNAIESAVSQGIAKEIAKKIVKETNVSTLITVIKLKKLKIDRKNCQKVATRGKAWSYASDALGIDPKSISRIFNNLKMACAEYVYYHLDEEVK